MRTLFLSLASILSLLLAQLPLLTDAGADIYRYEDQEGVVHFTDTPTDGKFTIHIRDIKKDRSLRTRFSIRGFADDPARYEPLIDRYSLQYGIDRKLVKAVIRAESNYNPRAVSKKGAAGLMQLMPQTARSLNVSDAFDPAENIRGGVKYLRFLLDTFNGNETLALAAYNAGLSTIARYGGVPPFAETRSYVSRVLDYKKTFQEN